MGDYLTAGHSYDTTTNKEITASNLNAHVNDAVLKATAISARTAKATPVDADTLLLHDSAASDLKKMTITALATAPALLALSNPVPSGVIAPFAGASAPTGWLLCNGAAVSRATYSGLFSAIGTAWGYGDQSTTFNLPDLRGRFLRGVDGSTGRDPDAATRTACNTGGNTGDAVGSVQDGEVGPHTHPMGQAVVPGAGAYFTAAGAQQGSSVTGTSTGDETRPINAGVHFIIKT